MGFRSEHEGMGAFGDQEEEWEAPGIYGEPSRELEENKEGVPRERKVQEEARNPLD